MEVNNRFYTFATEKNKYVFDNYTKQIYNIEDEIYNNLNDRVFDISKYPETNRSEIQSIFNAEEMKVGKYQQKKCYITINISNKCNLDCIYCYKNPKNKNYLSRKNLEEIVDFATKTYMPEASEYVFSFGFTSEPLLDIELIKDFDEIIANNEGYLLKKNDFIKNSAKELFEKFPQKIQEKYSERINNINYITIINEILKNESLWSFWTEIKDNYINKILTYTNNLSKQKSAMVNRKILNEKFPELIKNPTVKYFTLYFCSNGTLINQKIIDLLKGFYMTEFCISLDGPEYVNNNTRNYLDGKSSYSDVINGIELLKKNNVKVNINTVITPKFLNLLELIDFFRKMNIYTLNFQIVRSEKYGFTLDSLNDFFKSFDDVLEKIFTEILNNDYSYVFFLKEHLFFKTLYKYYYKTFLTRRCDWGDKLSINSNGELFHCDYTYELERSIGTYKDKIQFVDINDGKHVDNNRKCANCFAKNLCGGTCYYTSLKTGNPIDEIECNYRKRIIKRVFQFYAKLIESNKLDKVINVLSGNNICNFITQNKHLYIDKQFILEQKKFDQIDGWFSPLSRAMFDSFLCYHKQEHIKGNCCEIGVWKGKSAIEISKFLDVDEKLLLIDPLINNNKTELYNHLSRITHQDDKKIELISSSSEDYNYDNEGVHYFNNVRFFHIDGCHVGENVYNDLKMADKFINRRGIVVIDDFFNIQYPQVTEAVYKYINNNEYSFKIFLIGTNKAYLCKPNSYSFYNNFCTNILQKELLKRGYGIKMMKTAPIADCFTYSFTIFDPLEDAASGLQGFDWEPNNFEIIFTKN